MRSKVDQFRDARLQRPRAMPKENKKKSVRDDRPKIEMRSVKLAVNDNAESEQIKNDGGGDATVAQTRAGQPLRAAVIFSDRLENDAPPKISVNLDVPFVPTGINRITPTFFFEQLENCAQQMMTIASFVAPKNSPP